VIITAIAVAMIRAPLLSVSHGGKLEQSASGGQNSRELSAQTKQRLCGPNGRLEERESSSLSTVGAHARSSTLRQLMSALVPCAFPLLFNGVVRIRIISIFSDFMRCHHRIYIEATPTESPCHEPCGSGHSRAFALGSGCRHQLRCWLDHDLSPKPLRVTAL